MMSANGVDSVADLQTLINNGQTLSTVQGLGWTDGFQDRYYGGPVNSGVSNVDYNDLASAMGDVDGYGTSTPNTGNTPYGSTNNSTLAGIPTNEDGWYGYTGNGNAQGDVPDLVSCHEVGITNTGISGNNSDLFNNDVIPNNLDIITQIYQINEDINNQNQIINAYNEYMTRTEGGSKIADILSAGNTTIDTVEDYMEAANWWANQMPGSDNLAGQVLWGMGTAIIGPVYGITMATEVAFSAALDFGIAFGNLFMPYPGQMEAENAADRIEYLENQRRQLEERMNDIIDNN